MGRAARESGGWSGRLPGRGGGRGGFTLIELLVVVGVIALLMGILMPSLSLARQTAQRTRCLANLKGIGVGVQVYLNEREGVLPYAMPLDNSSWPGGAPQRDSILEAFGPMVDTMEVFLCPSDASIPRDLEEPIGRHTSFEYWAGTLMVSREIFQDDRNPARTVTTFYELNPQFPVFADSEPRHPGAGEYDQNALYYGDWRADWLTLDPSDSVPSGP